MSWSLPLPLLIRLVTSDQSVGAKVHPMFGKSLGLWTRYNCLCNMTGVGSVNNTFGIEGVAENTFFFKSIDDANRLRRQVSECFERAALPQSSQQVCDEPPSELPASPGLRSSAPLECCSCSVGC